MRILGVKIDNVDMQEALQKAESLFRKAGTRYIVTPNPEFLVEAQRNSQFKKILNQADLSLPDGMGLVLASWLLGRPLKARVAGVDFMERMCERAACQKWPVLLLGGRPGAARKAADNLRRRHGALKVCALDENCLKFPKNILTPSPILFVALGAPRQEEWIWRNLKKMPRVELAVGVGGAFDFLSGRVRRAPYPMRRLGLEWLWRFACQPRRIRRISRAVLVFPWLVFINEILRHKK